MRPDERRAVKSAPEASYGGQQSPQAPQQIGDDESGVWEKSVEESMDTNNPCAYGNELIGSCKP
jgi:hypothetical protein